MRFRDDNAGSQVSGFGIRLVRHGLPGALGEPDQLLRLARYRAAHPEVIIGDGGFGTVQARLPEPDVLAWDQSQARLFEAICRHTALAALAQLRAAAIRGALDGSITLPAAGPAAGPAGDRARGTDHGISDAELQIPLGDAPVPDSGGQPCPAGIAPIRLSIAETIRLTVLARQHAAGLITRARLAFALRWSLRRRLHQAAARWHHYSARLLAARTG